MTEKADDLIAEAREAVKLYDRMVTLPAPDIIEREAGRNLQYQVRQPADALEARHPSEGEYILKLIESVKGSRSSVEIDGVKIMPCDEFGRTAAVPDAATELRAERDAALAAIERVRALETFSMTDSYMAWTAVDHDDLLAALDVAPEPEWEWADRLWGEKP